MFLALLFLALFAASELGSPSQGQRVARAPLKIRTASDATNWAGAVLNDAARTWQSITAQFDVPALRAPNGGSGRYAAAVLVGLDGDTCTTASLRTGIEMVIDGGASSYQAWWEWWPAARGTFADFAVAAGDTITANVVTDSSTGTSGTVILTNLRSGESATQSLSEAATPLCGQDAGWAVAEVPGAPLADFGSVTFTDAAAFGVPGIVGPEDANIYEIVQGGTVVTNVVVGTNSVVVSYLGS